MKHILRSILIIIFWVGIISLTFSRLGDIPTIDMIKVQLDNPSTLLAIKSFSIFFLIALTLRSLRFYIMLRHISEVGAFDIFTIFFWTFLVGAVSPLRLGEGTRLIWAKGKGVSLPKVIVAWLFERGSDLFVVISLVALGLLATIYDFLILELFVLVLVLPLALMLIARYIFSHFIRNGYIAEKLKSILGADKLKGIGEILLSTEYLLVIYLTALIWLMMVCAFWFGYRELIPNLSLNACIILVGAINLAFFFTLLPGNAVGYQIAAVATLEPFAISPDSSLAAAIIIHSITLAILIFIGVFSRILRLFAGYKDVF